LATKLPFANDNDYKMNIKCGNKTVAETACISFLAVELGMRRCWFPFDVVKNLVCPLVVRDNMIDAKGCEELLDVMCNGRKCEVLLSLSLHRTAMRRMKRLTGPIASLLINRE